MILNINSVAIVTVIPEGGKEASLVREVFILQITASTDCVYSRVLSDKHKYSWQIRCIMTSAGKSYLGNTFQIKQACKLRFAWRQCVFSSQMHLYWGGPSYPTIFQLEVLKTLPILLRPSWLCDHRCALSPAASTAQAMLCLKVALSGTECPWFFVCLCFFDSLL